MSNAQRAMELEAKANDYRARGMVRCAAVAQAEADSLWADEMAQAAWEADAAAERANQRYFEEGPFNPHDYEYRPQGNYEDIQAQWDC
jgi:hypothetical protein